ncbi:MAG: hypothetical protein KMY54_04145 [Erysipelothrix sp.]|nr:hypothetical protein [Erysipelothrix sp.]
MNRGFILIEALISLFAYSFFLIMLSSITFALLNMPKSIFLTQLDVFELQLNQLLHQSYNFKQKDDHFCFTLDIRDFCIVFENERLVKTPGYEILIDNISEIQWDLNESELTLRGFYSEKSFILVFDIE